MNITVKLFGGLEKHVPGATNSKPILLDLPERSTVSDLLEYLDIPSEEVFSVLLNYRYSKKDQVLKNGDQVSFFRAVGGG